MDKKTAKNVIKAISIIDYIFGALIIIGAILLFAGGTVLTAFGGFGDLVGVPGGLAGGALIFVGIVTLVFGLIYIWLGRAIKEHKKWARVLQVILGVIGLFSFPIGTAFGIFVIWALLINKDTKKFFK